MNYCGSCRMFDRGKCHINPPHILFDGTTWFSVRPEVGAADAACTAFRGNQHDDADAVLAALKTTPATGE